MLGHVRPGRRRGAGGAPAGGDLVTPSEMGDMFWLIGWCVLLICIAAVCIALIKYDRF
jgi:hypothetical protein